MKKMFGFLLAVAMIAMLVVTPISVAANGQDVDINMGDERTLENLVKKYAKQVTPLKKITPHKLRSTYGTALYQETGDIYLVADVLGHKDVNTTRKHYASVGDQRRRTAAKYVKLRED